MTPEAALFGWKDAHADCSHAYLLPAVQAGLARHFGQRQLRILDLGCGNGALTARLAAMGHSVTGVDASPDGIQIAKKAFPDITFQMMSVYDVAESFGREFDCVVSLEVIEHLYYPSRLFKAVNSVLAHEGLLILSTPYHGYLKNLAISALDGWDRHFHVERDGGHIKFFSRRSLKRMAAAHDLGDFEFVGVGRVPFLWKSMVLFARRI